MCYFLFCETTFWNEIFNLETDWYDLITRKFFHGGKILCLEIFRSTASWLKSSKSYYSTDQNEDIHFIFLGSILENLNTEHQSNYSKILCNERQVYSGFVEMTNSTHTRLKYILCSRFSKSHRIFYLGIRKDKWQSWLLSICDECRLLRIA